MTRQQFLVLLVVSPMTVLFGRCKKEEYNLYSSTYPEWNARTFTGNAPTKSDIIKLINKLVIIP
ncbi:hypothetical protein LCGC14_2571350 [marine sediment metagenome]|uniref:Uncharacterized protein n=1 Tax=marine sediment metagenome TaxID=412755 RepID=A0A0F9DA23_9ZZZZ